MARWQWRRRPSPSSNPPSLGSSSPGRSLVLSSTGALSTILGWRSSIGVSSIRSLSSQSIALSSNLIVEGVELLSSRAVKVEPPVTDEVVLVEEGSVGAEEAVLGEATGAVSSADVEGLALSLGVRVVTSIDLSVTEEARLRDLGIDGVVLSGHAGDGAL